MKLFIIISLFIVSSISLSQENVGVNFNWVSYNVITTYCGAEAELFLKIQNLEIDETLGNDIMNIHFTLGRGLLLGNERLL